MRWLRVAGAVIAVLAVSVVYALAPELARTTQVPHILPFITPSSAYTESTFATSTSGTSAATTPLWWTPSGVGVLPGGRW